MGLYDDIKPDALRADLRYFAELILRLDSDGQILLATPRILKMMGDLRAKIFAYEVRVTGRLAPEPDEPSELREARRIIEEAMRREDDAAGEWNRPWSPDSEPD